MPKELILVNDKSTDGTPAILEALQKQYDNVRVFHQPVNMGKGAALREGFKHATGDVRDRAGRRLGVRPGRVPASWCSRSSTAGRTWCSAAGSSARRHRVLYFWHSLANKGLTMLSNVFTDLNLTDMETCYKVFRREVIQSMDR